MSFDTWFLFESAYLLYYLLKYAFARFKFHIERILLCLILKKKSKVTLIKCKMNTSILCMVIVNFKANYLLRSSIENQKLCIPNTWSDCFLKKSLTIQFLNFEIFTRFMKKNLFPVKNWKSIDLKLENAISCEIEWVFCVGKLDDWIRGWYVLNDSTRIDHIQYSERKMTD